MCHWVCELEQMITNFLIWLSFESMIISNKSQVYSDTMCACMCSTHTINSKCDSHLIGAYNTAVYCMYYRHVRENFSDGGRGSYIMHAQSAHDFYPWYPNISILKLTFQWFTFKTCLLLFSIILMIIWGIPGCSHLCMKPDCLSEMYTRDRDSRTCQARKFFCSGLLNFTSMYHNIRTQVTLCMLFCILMVHTRIFGRQVILPLLKKMKTFVHVHQNLSVRRTEFCVRGCLLQRVCDRLQDILPHTCDDLQYMSLFFSQLMYSRNHEWLLYVHVHVNLNIQNDIY